MWFKLFEKIEVIIATVQIVQINYNLIIVSHDDDMMMMIMMMI